MANQNATSTNPTPIKAPWGKSNNKNGVPRGNPTTFPGLAPGVWAANVSSSPAAGALAKKLGKAVTAVPRAIGRGVKKVGHYLKENERRNNAAAAEMDKRYPSGWAQSATNMAELNQIKKKIK